jgi:hypothetical protein
MNLLNSWILEKKVARKLLDDLQENHNKRGEMENTWHGRGFEKISYELPKKGNQLVICMDGQSLHVSNVLGSYHVEHYANTTNELEVV